MITEFEEHCQGSAKVQFTVSRTSLTSLLEWSERLQARFRVTIDIQWELDPEAENIRDTTQVRWVAVSGNAEDCKKAKNYITIFCDSEHHVYVNYPVYIHTELKERQTHLEETYSAVLQFCDVGRLLIKSKDVLNLSLVASVIEDIALHHQSREMGRLEWSGSGGSRGHVEESYPSYLMDDNLDVDSIVEDNTSITAEGTSQLPKTPTAVSNTPSEMCDPMDLLGGGPLMLRGKGDRIFAGQLIDLISPASSQEAYSISPDRKKIKSQTYNKGGQGSQSAVPKACAKDSSSIPLSLNSQQELAIQRVLRRGEYTESEIQRFLQKVGSNWQCSDLITMLHLERRQRNVPQVPSRHETSSKIKLEKMKSTQESLMQSVLENVSSDLIAHANSSDLRPKRLSTPASQTSNVQRMIREGEVFSGYNQGAEPLQQDDEVGNHSGVDDMDSVVVLEDSDSVIIIPSDSESAEESDTYEVFYRSGVPEVKPKQPGSRLSHDAVKQTSHSGLRAADKQQNVELQGVVEGLKQQLTYLQDKMELEKAEVSSQQQTQLEEMQRQYEQQQKRLLEQQQQFQKQFEMQEQELKTQQKIALKELQQQQQKQQQLVAAPDNPSEGIVIAPIRKNLASPFRPVVIDGSNVAMAHGRGSIYSCCGIAICIQYFQKRGHHDITVFVPQGRRTQNPNSIDRPMKDQKILEQLEKQGLLSFTPSRRIGNSYVNCYDDRFIVKLAVETGGVIVSNDNYRDLMGESPEWKYVVENRLVMYTFAGDLFMIPDDPLGRSGPRIDQILRKSPNPGNMTNMASFPRLAVSRPPVPTSLLKARGRITASNAMPWGLGAATGTQVVKRIAHSAQGKPVTASMAMTKQIFPAPTFGKVPGRNQRDFTQHPSYETLISIFPDNEKDVIKVLDQHGEKTDSNELVILVLVEKEKSDTKS